MQEYFVGNRSKSNAASFQTLIYMIYGLFYKGHGSHIFWLTNFPDYSRIFPHFPVFHLMNLTNTKIFNLQSREKIQIKTDTIPSLFQSVIIAQLFSENVFQVL